MKIRWYFKGSITMRTMRTITLFCLAMVLPLGFTLASISVIKHPTPPQVELKFRDMIFIAAVFFAPTIIAYWCGRNSKP